MNNYKKKRLEKGISKTFAANLLGISYSHLNNIENNIRNPSKSLIFKMCKLYECKIDDLFFAKELFKLHI